MGKLTRRLDLPSKVLETELPPLLAEYADVVVDPPEEDVFEELRFLASRRTLRSLLRRSPLTEDDSFAGGSLTAIVLDRNAARRVQHALVARALVPHGLHVSESVDRAMLALDRTVAAVEVHRDDRARLHRADGPAVVLADGREFYRFHGVDVPAIWLTSPDNPNVDDVRSEANLERKRVATELYVSPNPEHGTGIAAYVVDAGAEVVDVDPRFGTLYRLTESLGRFSRDVTYQVVRVRNSTPEPDGSVREFLLNVPLEWWPGGRQWEQDPNGIIRRIDPTQIDTARAAVAWTFSMTAEEYDPVRES